jgi:hypothetical protein
MEGEKYVPLLKDKSKIQFSNSTAKFQTRTKNMAGITMD